MLQRLLILLAVVCFGVFVGDYLVFQVRVHSDSRSAFATVQMERMYAIPQKGGRVEFQFDAQQPQETVQCVRALFPHAGFSPCWYLRRNAQKVIPMSLVVVP